MSREEKYLRAVIAKLEHFCAYQERCFQDVHKKLKNFELTAEAKRAAIAHLEANKFLDQARFIGSFIRDRFRFKRWGRIRLRQELRLKGITQSEIEEALEAELQPEAYKEQLRELLEIKNRAVREEDPYKRKQKLAKFALSRGFEMDLIWEALRKFNLQTDDDFEPDEL